MPDTLDTASADRTAPTDGDERGSPANAASSLPKRDAHGRRPHPSGAGDAPPADGSRRDRRRKRSGRHIEGTAVEVFDAICRDFERTRKKDKETAHRQLLLDLMANAGTLTTPGEGIFTGKDFLAAVREQEEFLKGGTPAGNKTPLEALTEFLA